MIIDKDNSYWTEKKVKSPEGSNNEKDENSKEQSKIKPEVFEGLGFGEQIIGTIVEHVVDKITHHGASGGVKPKLPLKQEEQNCTNGKLQTRGCLCM